MVARERNGRGRTGIVEHVVSNLRRRLTRVARDALVAVVLLTLAVVVVGAAASVLGFAVSNGGIAGIVLGWTAAFAVAVSLPVLAMKVAVAVYERVGG